MNKKCLIQSLFISLLILSLPALTFAEEVKEEQASFSVLSHILDLSKENTEQLAEEDYESVEPSELTAELLETTAVTINNSEVIKLLNETTLSPSPIAIGYRGKVYLGRWPLGYESKATEVNWEYQVMNKNEINNLGGDDTQILTYSQNERQELKGTLLNKVIQPDVVRKMILEKTEKKTNLPLTYSAVIGKNTKIGQTYNVPAKKYGILEAYAPAVKESGEVIYGEVYIELKGAKKSLLVKNVTKQEISAWLPVQNHLAFSFQIK